MIESGSFGVGFAILDESGNPIRNNKTFNYFNAVMLFNNYEIQIDFVKCTNEMIGNQFKEVLNLIMYLDFRSFCSPS